MTLLGTPRLVLVAWWLHVRMMSRSALQGLLMVMWPLFFATTALLMYRTRAGGDQLWNAALGGGVMTVWSAVGTVGSEVLQRERGYGTLELLVAAPVPFAIVIFPHTLAVATIGGYGMAVTLLWAHVAFGVAMPVAQPVVFAGAMVVTVLAIAAMGFVLSVTVVRYRASWALGNVLEYPVWLVCGLLVPMSTLPGWLRPVSWALAPTWGVQAIRDAASGRPAAAPLAVCAALALVYFLVGAGLAETVLRSARRHATIALT
jgi:ABC-2 type transport system permease protein